MKNNITYESIRRALMTMWQDAKEKSAFYWFVMYHFVLAENHELREEIKEIKNGRNQG